MTNRSPLRRVSLFERGLVFPNRFKRVILICAAIASLVSMGFGAYVLADIVRRVNPHSDHLEMLIEVGSVFAGFGASGLFFSLRALVRLREKEIREARMAPFRRK